MLMTLRKKMMKNRKKGFTLVEVIVVLVIIAILAAIAIPALTGYIEKANEKAVLSQTRSAVVAAQTIISNGYGEGETIDQAWINTNVKAADITALSGDASIVSVSGITINASNAVAKLRVGTSNGKTGVYDAAETPPYSIDPA